MAKSEKRTRVTCQKIQIMSFINNAKNHPTAEMVHKELVKTLPAISLATVYRNLNQLAETGAILRMNVDGGYRYDSDTGCHQHFICKKCGAVMDLGDSGISDYAMGKIGSLGLKADCVRILFYGSCKGCKKSK